VVDAGFLPFSAIYIELYYIFASVWGHKVYTIYSILFIVFIILIIVTAFITIALTYFQLAVEDHRWWWRSFVCGGSTGQLTLIPLFTCTPTVCSLYLSGSRFLDLQHHQIYLRRVRVLHLGSGSWCASLGWLLSTMIDMSLAGICNSCCHVRQSDNSHCIYSAALLRCSKLSI